MLSIDVRRFARFADTRQSYQKIRQASGFLARMVYTKNYHQNFKENTTTKDEDTLPLCSKRTW